MSLDNVLAVAGAARDHPGILIIGLVLSVALMGIAANFIAKYIERYRWIAWVGLVVILYVAGKMIYDGAGTTSACSDTRLAGTPRLLDRRPAQPRCSAKKASVRWSASCAASSLRRLPISAAKPWSSPG